MTKSIDIKKIGDYSKKFRERFQDTSVIDKPLKVAFLNEEVIKENKFEFNIELEDCKIYNQKTSLRCWLFATLNIIKNDVAHNLSVDKMQFALSANYLSFFDKLEKANHAYQIIIDEYDISKSDFLDFDNNRYLAEFLKEPVLENGKFEYARALIKKYGLVPTEIMPETCNSENPDQLIELYFQKVRYDIFKLIESKQKSRDLYKLKNEMLTENYGMLAKILGEPPHKFNYKYKNLDGNSVKLNNITPQKFYKKFCKINLDDFIMIGNVPLTNKPFYKKFRRAYSSNVDGESYSEYINLPFEEFQELCIMQLKNNMPVCFSCDNKKYRNVESTVFDTRLFDYEKFLGVKDMDKHQALESCDITLRHLMVFRGVHIENGKPIRWKVEDSAGEENRIGGYYVMNQNFFEKCVCQACIHKKFLSQKQLDVTNSEPILCSYRGLV